MRIESVLLHLIDPPADDDRLERDAAAIDRLACDIRKQGLINPPSIEEKGNRYECIAGWTRILAMRSLQEQTIHARIYPPLDAQRRQHIRLSENLQRSDLTPIEEARRLFQLQRDEKLDADALAAIVQRSTAWVEQRLTLLSVPDDLQALVHERDLSIGAALALARCTEPAHRAYLTNYAVNGGATITTVRAWVEEWRIHHEQGLDGPAPLPPMPIANQPVLVLIPCARCHTPHDYRTTCVVRVCQPCGRDIANEQQHPNRERTDELPVG